MAYGLSKSKLMAHLQCPKRLWLQVHRPELTEWAGASAIAIPHGYGVGQPARTPLPDGEPSDGTVPAWVCRQSGLALSLVKLAHVDSGSSIQAAATTADCCGTPI